MKIKQNNKLYTLAYHSSGSLSGQSPTYWYLDGIDTVGHMMGLIGPQNLKPVATSKRELVQVARRIIRAGGVK